MGGSGYDVTGLGSSQDNNKKSFSDFKGPTPGRLVSELWFEMNYYSVIKKKPSTLDLGTVQHKQSLILLLWSTFATIFDKRVIVTLRSIIQRQGGHSVGFGPTGP